MHKDLLLTLIKNPNLTSQNDTQVLLDLTKKYPYFHAAFNLLLINLRKTNNELYDKALHESALIIADRKHLFNVLHKINATENLTEKEAVINDISVDVEFPQNIAVEFQEDDPATPYTPENLQQDEDLKANLLEIDESQPIDKEDLINSGFEEQFSDSKKDIPLFEKSSFEFDQKSIIDKFIEENPAFSAKKIEPAEDRQDISLDSIKEDDNLVSETLANIFEMQKLYDKAIDVYQKLILKYPEKSAYFASRIENIRNNI